MSFLNITLKEYNKILSSSKPVPGGGSVAALTAGCSMSMLIMSIEVTLLKLVSIDRDEKYINFCSNYTCFGFYNEFDCKSYTNVLELNLKKIMLYKDVFLKFVDVDSELFMSLIQGMRIGLKPIYLNRFYITIALFCLSFLEKIVELMFYIKGMYKYIYKYIISDILSAFYTLKSSFDTTFMHFLINLNAFDVNLYNNRNLYIMNISNLNFKANFLKNRFNNLYKSEVHSLQNIFGL